MKKTLFILILFLVYLPKVFAQNLATSQMYYTYSADSEKTVENSFALDEKIFSDTLLGLGFFSVGQMDQGEKIPMWGALAKIYYEWNDRVVVGGEFQFERSNSDYKARESVAFLRYFGDSWILTPQLSKHVVQFKTLDSALAKESIVKFERIGVGLEIKYINDYISYWIGHSEYLYSRDMSIFDSDYIEVFVPANVMNFLPGESKRISYLGLDYLLTTTVLGCQFKISDSSIDQSKTSNFELFSSWKLNKIWSLDLMLGAAATAGTENTEDSYYYSSIGITYKLPDLFAENK